MSREILRRLLRPAEPPRRFGVVVGVVSGGRYLVTDDTGRGLQLTVDGDAGYLPGEPVIIKDGRITGRGGRARAIKTYRV